MIYGMLISFCIVVGVYSRKLYCNSEGALDEGITTLAIFLDIISLMVALVVLAEYWNVLPPIN